MVLSAGLVLASASTCAQRHLALASLGQIIAGSIIKGDIKRANLTSGSKDQTITNAQLKAVNITWAT
jgi:hypothetical protein